MSKGKTKAWRKIKKQMNPQTGQVERYGRRFRNAMQHFAQQKPTGYALLNTMLARAGVYEVSTETVTMTEEEASAT